MRTCIDTLNFSYLKSLVEEAQTLANRMEAALEDKSAIAGYHKKIKELKNEKAKLEEEIETLNLTK
jgi:cell division protein FtsB